MKKSIIILLFIAGTIGILCCNSSKKEVHVTNVKATTISNDQEPFNSFINRFFEDSIFMCNRIEDSLVGFNSDYYYREIDSLLNIGYEIPDSIDEEELSSMSDYCWNKSDAIPYLIDIRNAIKSPEYKVEIRKEHDDAEVYIFIPDSSVFYKCKYKINKGKWFLCSLIVNFV
jgi:hypothetical protein